jgi:prepilin-type N-terminal cleavage/methylation domain-containing protein
MTIQRRIGFTLIELLIAISLVAILAIMALLLINPARLIARARDFERISVMKAIEKGLTVYLAENFEYPNVATGDTLYGYEYRAGDCTSPINLKFDNSMSNGFVEELTLLGIVTAPNLAIWNDPLHPRFSDNSTWKYNCRYVVPESEFNLSNIQRFLIHCNLEANPNLEANDSGTNPTIYEIMRPAAPPWVCVLGNYD